MNINPPINLIDVHNDVDETLADYHRQMCLDNQIVCMQP